MRFAGHRCKVAGERGPTMAPIQSASDYSKLLNPRRPSFCLLLLRPLSQRLKEDRHVPPEL